MSQDRHDSPIVPRFLAVPSRDEFRAMPDEERDAWITDPEKFAALRARTTREHDARYRPMVIALIAAGWAFEIPDHCDDMMSWAWRRPPRRAKGPGRRFASTDQAYNAMVREKGTP